MPGRWLQRTLASLYVASPAQPLTKGAARLFDPEVHYVEAEFEAQPLVSGHGGAHGYHGAASLRRAGRTRGGLRVGIPSPQRGRPWRRRCTARSTFPHEYLGGSRTCPSRPGSGSRPYPPSGPGPRRCSSGDLFCFRSQAEMGTLSLTSGAPRSSTTSGGTIISVFECASRSGLEHALRGVR